MNASLEAEHVSGDGSGVRGDRGDMIHIPSGSLYGDPFAPWGLDLRIRGCERGKVARLSRHADHLVPCDYGLQAFLFGGHESL